MVKRRDVPPPPTVLAQLVRQRAVVMLTTGAGVLGVLWDADATGLLVRPSAGDPVVMIDQSGAQAPADGEVFVPADKIEFVQVLGAGAG